jgi:sarcosine oxidase subunit alpha
MGTDQGKMSNIAGLAILADQLAVPIPKVGTTTFRPPYTPVTLGAYPGHADRPSRRTDALLGNARLARRGRGTLRQRWSMEAAAFVSASGESEFDAANREAKNVRTNVGVVDVSTLGKIELQGRDVARC